MYTGIKMSLFDHIRIFPIFEFNYNHTMTLDQKFKSATPVEKVLIVLACLCFICICVFTTVHSGFYSESSIDSTTKRMSFLNPVQLWLLNSVLGIGGGILMNHKKLFISGVSGLVAALGITGFAIWYLSFRETVISYEMLLIMGLGCLPGVLLYRFLTR